RRPHAAPLPPICRLDALFTPEYDRPRSGWGMHLAGTGRTLTRPFPRKKDFQGRKPITRTADGQGYLASRFTLMILRRRGADVLVRAPAKVNLFLEVLRRRADGYHELATLMTAVSLYDTLWLRNDPSGSVLLQCDRPDLSAGPDNLVCRAAELLRRRAGRDLGADIRLWKRIPMQAGLGGGSSDAAAALAGLNALWRLGLTAAELAGLGAELGSDVTFFFAAPAAWCTGRGEKVERIALGRPLHFVLVSPSVGLSTAEVFGNVTSPGDPLTGEEVRRAAEAGNVEEIGRRLHNRLQASAEQLRPETAEWRERLADLKPAGTLMTGSGSTIFALCRSPEEAWRVARGLDAFREEGGGPRVHIVRSCV
ncbi:MAG TPA: 4-(cytidine 5'-diphospho)-2-C-methyl-D-erythritol kinase, partial [Gemmataceae bacterium]|nr:4-(cytidine 5'-diphospho)-2-C-methyl-D-erythritol kinase [Gemmataceae bacterium]